MDSKWLMQGGLDRIKVGDEEYHFLYGERKESVGFRLKLIDFRIKFNPGTTQPASFESDVEVIDDFRGITKETTISMNEPLDYNGFRIFQASYMLPEDGSPEISIFAVVKDPGIWTKYIGTIIMVTGILIMFFTGRFNFKKKE